VSCCGLWNTPRRLVAVVVDRNGVPAPPISVPRTDDARWAFVASLPTVSFGLVLTDSLARDDTIARIAVRHGVRVWTAPASVVEGVRYLVGLAGRHPKISAAMLARWPSVPVLRGYLRLAAPDVDQRQMRFC
jgi:hypothetical protein